MKNNKILIIVIILFCSTACTSQKKVMMGEKLPVDNKKYYEIEEEIEAGVKRYASENLTGSATKKYDLDFFIDNGFVSQTIFNDESCDGYVLVKRNQDKACTGVYINCENYITENYGTSELTESCGNSSSNNGELKNYVGKNYLEAKTELEQLGYRVFVEISDKGLRKENIVISQNKNENDTIILTISKVLTTYPDFTTGDYTLDDLNNFSDTYEINLTINYQTSSIYKSGAIIEQSREAGSSIISGQTLKITIVE